MKCKTCKTEKLSNEFPSSYVNSKCGHPLFSCLRCTVEHIKEHKKCPHCDLAPDTNVQQLYEATLASLFAVYDTTYSQDDLTPTNLPTGGTLTITVLNGDCITIPYDPNRTIISIQEEIKKKLGLEVDKQRLKDTSEQDIKDSLESGILTKLSNYPSIKPGMTIYAYEELYAIPKHFDHVVFDLFWGYPYSGKDFLDASCLVFSGTSHTGLIDYQNQGFQGINHSGDVMDDTKRQGHHTIEVKLKSIPSNVTHLFFTLSAWNSPTIARYPNPSLKFYQASDKTKDLCKTTFGHAAHSQAVVMCFASRKSGQWRIINSGVLSAGNAKNYRVIIQTIQSIISKGI